jgi:hypothetical protein
MIVTVSTLIALHFLFSKIVIYIAKKQLATLLANPMDIEVSSL